jgi:endonuclease-3
VTASDPVKIESALKSLYPESDWEAVSMRFIHFGRDVCDARKPACVGCPLADRCTFPNKTGA